MPFVGARCSKRPGRSHDLPRAVAAYTRACDHQDAVSCLRLAEALLQGRGVARNVTAGDRARRQGLRPRGGRAGAPSRARSGPRRRTSPVPFRHSNVRAAPASRSHARSSGTRHEAGNGVTRDVKRAASEFEQGCRSGLGAGVHARRSAVRTCARACESGEGRAHLRARLRSGTAESCFNSASCTPKDADGRRTRQRRSTTTTRPAAAGFGRCARSSTQLRRRPPLSRPLSRRLPRPK